MWAFVARRLLYAIPTLVGVTLVTFVLFHYVAPDPALVKAGKGASPADVQRTRHELGTDRPAAVQYWDFLEQTFTLHFGESWMTKRNVGDMLWEGLGPSLSVTLPAFLLGTFFAVSLSLFCAFYRNSLADRTTVVAAVAGMSISSLAYIIFGQYFVAYEWNLLPVFGYEPTLRGIVFLLQPWLIWIMLSTGGDVRFYRTAILDEMQQDYVRTAAAKGLGTRRILFRHILKNAMIPIITRAVIVIPFLFVGSLLLERFFGIPGLGYLSIESVNTQDFPVIKAMVVLGAILYILFNLLSDVLYAWVDPRVRLK
jgi:peptide/nickel transport system permease protein